MSNHSSPQTHLVWVTDKDLEDLPDWAVISDRAGRTSGIDLSPRQWALFHVGEFNEQVKLELMRRGIRAIPFNPECCDGEAPRNADDYDAALAFLDEGGALVRVPDELGSKHSRLYAVLPLPKQHKYVEERYLMDNEDDEIVLSGEHDPKCDLVLGERVGMSKGEVDLVILKPRGRVPSQIDEIQKLLQEQLDRDKAQGLLVLKRKE